MKEEIEKGSKTQKFLTTFVYYTQLKYLLIKLFHLLLEPYFYFLKVVQRLRENKKDTD